MRSSFIHLLGILWVTAGPSAVTALSLSPWLRIPQSFLGSAFHDVITTNANTVSNPIQEVRHTDVIPGSVTERTTVYGSTVGRREMLTGAAAAAMLLTASAPSTARAYDNAVPEAKDYADKPKRRGTAPKDLGVSPRTTEGQDNLDSVTRPGLRTCDGNPNCFSTTGDYELADRVQRGVDFLVAPWKPDPDDTSPLQTVAAVLRAYPPGQGGIDGGGFSLVKQTDNYLYYRFESLKKGYIDDVEFATSAGGTILVRSASRIGYTDFGVNAIRLNYVAAILRSKGWTVAEITPETHRDYWLASDAAREATFDASRRELVGGEEVKDTVKASQVFNR